MRSKIQLTADDLKQHLDEQLAFLRASADAFDSGFTSEAKRLAVTLRVLLHDTAKSTSLLTQLNGKARTFLDSALPNTPGNLSTHGGLVFIAVAPPETRYVAMLDQVPFPDKWEEFQTWWTAPVFVDRFKRELSRKDLVLTASNQDGGAHVDPALDEVYADLSKRNSLNWHVEGSATQNPLEDPEKAAIRQIAHEVLKTLILGYVKKPIHEAGVIFGGMSVVAHNGLVPVASAEVAGRRRPGRNEQCPCGSGKKYKHCHGR